MRIFIIIFLAAVCFFPAEIGAESLPGWLIPLREAIYEQKLSANQVVPIYNAAKASARGNLTGPALDVALSRCEYFMGRAYQFENRNSEAADRYAEGMTLAQKAIDAAPSAAAWVMLAENLSQSCVVRSNAYAMRYGANVERYARNALTFDSRNAAAQYLIAARWVFAPAPFHNHRRGIEMMEDIIRNGNMQKDDRFNVLSAIGYAYLEQKKPDEARPWLQRSLEIYPTNKFVAGLLNNR